MRVEAELLDHPKFLRLKRRLGPYALEGLLRVWGHCQNAQRGGVWKRADIEYVEVVARWDGKPGDFYAAMLDVRFIEERGGAVVIHDWDRMNSRALASWSNGHLGGRPRANPTSTSKSPGSSQDNPEKTHGLPMANQSEGVSEGVSDLGTERERKGRRGKTRKADLASLQASKILYGQLKQSIDALERVAKEDLTAEEAAELRKKRAELSALQKKQAEMFTA